MSAVIIDGQARKEQILRDLAPVMADLRAQEIVPTLAVVLVGQDAASRVYVRNKVETSKKLGIQSREYRLPETTRFPELLELIDQLNADSKVDGILVQLPLPKHMDAAVVTERIDPAKDVDGFHSVNVAGLSHGVASALLPCTPHGSLLLIRSALAAMNTTLSGKHAVIVGRSAIVGKPMALLLLHAHMTVTIAHSRTQDLGAVCRQADVLVVAVGVPELIQADMVKPGAIVIDVGINRGPVNPNTGKSPLLGDVHTQSVRAVAGAITPVPGGVGPMTIAMLLVNTVVAACRRRNGSVPEALETILS